MMRADLYGWEAEEILKSFQQIGRQLQFYGNFLWYVKGWQRDAEWAQRMGLT